MESKFKVEGIIWKVTEGKTTEVKINEDIFVLKSSKEKIVQLPESDEIIETVSPLVSHAIEIPVLDEKQLGEKLQLSIYVNPLNEILNSLREGNNDQNHLKNILRSYHRNILDNSITTYFLGYKKYIGEKYPDLKHLVSIRHMTFQSPIQSPIELKQRSSKDKRGKLIARFGHNSIYENPLNEMKKALEEGKNRNHLESIIKDLYETDNQSSMNTYISCYKRYIAGEIKQPQTTEKQSYPERYDAIKGRVLGYENNPIYENVLNDIKTAIIENKTKNQILSNVMKKYYPRIKKQSLTTYYRSYIRWIHKEEKKPAMALSYERKKRKPREVPEGCVGWDNSYNRFIEKEEVSKIKKAMLHVELNYEPSVKNISKQSGLDEHNVRGAIHWMRDNDIIEMKYNENLIPIYTLIDSNGSGENNSKA